MIERIAYVLRDIADMWTATAVPGPIIVIMAVVLSCFLGLACITGWSLGMFDAAAILAFLFCLIAVPVLVTWTLLAGCLWFGW